MRVKRRCSTSIGNGWPLYLIVFISFGAPASCKTRKWSAPACHLEGKGEGYRGWLTEEADTVHPPSHPAWQRTCYPLPSSLSLSLLPSSFVHNMCVRETTFPLDVCYYTYACLCYKHARVFHWDKWLPSFGVAILFFFIHNWGKGKMNFYYHFFS